MFFRAAASAIVGTDGASGAAATGQPGRYGSGFLVQPVAVRREWRCGSSLARVGAPRRLYTAFALRPAPQQTVITERRQSLELRVAGVPGGFNLPHMDYSGARERQTRTGY